jgi:hypothetical protein
MIYYNKIKEDNPLFLIEINERHKFCCPVLYFMGQKMGALFCLV